MIPRDANIIKYKCIEYVDDIDWTLCFKINATRGHNYALIRQNLPIYKYQTTPFRYEHFLQCVKKMCLQMLTIEPGN